MKEILTKVEKKDGILVVSSRVIAEQLGKRHSDVLEQLDKILGVSLNIGNLIIPSTYEVVGQNRKYKEYLLTSGGLGVYLNRIQSINKTISEFLLNFADIKQFHSYTRFELAFIDTLNEALNELGITGVRQFSVGKYKIDFYIPKLNIVVEYDEKHHQLSTNIQSDKIRQDYIEKELNCKFIRCDYKDSDIKNVMKVVKYIHNVSF